jgi:hypothetical protein
MVEDNRTLPATGRQESLTAIAETGMLVEEARLEVQEDFR